MRARRGRRGRGLGGGASIRTKIHRLSAIMERDSVSEP